MEAFWDQRKVEWGGALTKLRESSLSTNEEVLLGRLEDKLVTMPIPLCSSSLEWKAWSWPGSLSFQKASTTTVYNWLSHSKNWHAHLNTMWGLAWTEERWSQTLTNVWQSKGLEQNKMFIIRVTLGILPTGEKIAARHIGDGRCIGCHQGTKTIKHIFWECPVIKNLVRNVCLWFHKKFKVPFFKRDLVLGPRTLRQKEMLDRACAVRYVVLRSIWLNRNECVFQHVHSPLKPKEIIYECNYVISQL